LVSPKPINENKGKYDEKNVPKYKRKGKEIIAFKDKYD